MTDAGIDWGAMETPLDEQPQFFVQPPDGRRDWAETPRQVKFRQLCAMFAPAVYVRATANAGKRNPRQARAEGIRAGVLDLCCHASGARTAYIEFKGYNAAGRPGKLSDSQIRFGNHMQGLGIPVACFFDPHDAYDWLKQQGFPCQEIPLAA